MAIIYIQGDSGGPLVTKESSYYSIIGTDNLFENKPSHVSIQVLSLGAGDVPGLTPPECIPASQNN